MNFFFLFFNFAKLQLVRLHIILTHLNHTINLKFMNENANRFIIDF